MVEPVSDVGVRRQVEDPVAPIHGIDENLEIEHVALHEPIGRIIQKRFEELSVACPEIVDDNDGYTGSGDHVGKVAADEAASACDTEAIHQA